ncbi:MAG: MCE family protein [Bdellovibrionaceae bacterium]|nr:MCE family protein [Bdellovibrio sp.]
MKQIKVGAFLLIGLVVLIGSIFTLGSNKSIFQDMIEVRSYFDSVQGLNLGAIVSLSGLKVGNIERITFDETKNLVEVVCRIDHQYKTKIKKDSRIEIRTQGALGDKFLYITPGTTASDAIANGDELKADYGNDILSILSKRGNESEKLFDAIGDFQKLIHSIVDQNKIPNLITHLDQASSHLAEVSASLEKTVKAGSLDRSLNKLENIIDKVDRGDGTLGALINDRSIHERIKSLLGAGQKDQQIKKILKSSVEE